MNSKKSGGPNLKMVAGSAALLCVVLVGASYFLRDGDQGAESEPPASQAQATTEAVAASRLEPLLKRCEQVFNEDAGGGRTKTRCIRKAHPAFMMEVVGAGDEVDKASLMVPMRGTTDTIFERIMVGLELFSLVAGAEPASFLPKDYLDGIGVRETSLVFQGRTYMTQRVASVGLMFAVLPESRDPAVEN